MTAAESAERLSALERAKVLGIDCKIEWLATLDGRTCHSHRMVDGEQVEVGEKFSNGCRYPGDPDAPYAETANCRCTVVAGFEDTDNSWKDEASKRLVGQSYGDWKGEHKPATEADSKTGGLAKLKKAAKGIWNTVKRVAKAQAEANAVYGRSAFQYSPKPRKQINLPAAEYAHVMDEIGTWYDHRFSGKAKFRMAIDDYVYNVEVVGDHMFRIVGKRKIR